MQKVKCLGCRQRGHAVADCKENVEETFNKDSSIKICYNCGSKEHPLSGCHLPVNNLNLPFAECFICKATGHLSAYCPKNKHGIYIKGGACYVCGQKNHLAKNCPDKQIKQDNNNRNFGKSSGVNGENRFLNKKVNRKNFDNTN